MAKLDGHLNFSPGKDTIFPHKAIRFTFFIISNILLGGIAFLKSSVRRGILPKMLEEILDTRQMVKRSMKLYNQEAKKNPGLNLIKEL